MVTVAPSQASSDEPFAVGSVLDGRYRIDGVLGTGGMGRVYRAEHTKIGRSVAIKVLHADLGRNREASQRFQREAIASGRLDHPNIVGVSDFGVLDDGACYLVMEVLEGESLGDRLARDKRIHWSEAIPIIRGVLHGLRHAHERGVVHRDIKPDNVYLAHKDGDPVIKILDFGIAKLWGVGNTDDPAQTRAGLTVGTPAYLSPEQAVGGKITPASDLYSASIVLYEMLAGRAPFEDRDPLAMLGAHVSRKPPRFAVIAPGIEIPPALEDIVQRGLVKTAADRIHTATDYLALLEELSPSPLGLRGTAVFETAGTGEPARYERLRTGPVHAQPAGMRTTAAGDPSHAEAAEDAAAPSSVTAVMTSAASLAASLVTPAAPAGPVSLAMASLPRAARVVTLAERGEPIPLTWIVRSGVLMGVMIIAALALAVASHCIGSAPNERAKPRRAGQRSSSIIIKYFHEQTISAAGSPECADDPDSRQRDISAFSVRTFG